MYRPKVARRSERLQQCLLPRAPWLLLIAGSFGAPGCWVVIGESFDGYSKPDATASEGGAASGGSETGGSSKNDGTSGTADGGVSSGGGSPSGGASPGQGGKNSQGATGGRGGESSSGDNEAGSHLGGKDSMGEAGAGGDGGYSGGLAGSAGESPASAGQPGAVRAVTSSEAVRTASFGEIPYELSHPEPLSGLGRLPLIVSFQSDADTGYQHLDFEETTRLRAVIARSGSFFERTPEATTRPAEFVQALTQELAAALDIDVTRVFLAGFDGGGATANSVACQLGSGAVRGVGVAAGTLYDPRHPAGEASCDALPAAILIWGAEDTAQTGGGFSKENGLGTLAHYAWTNGCTGAAAPPTNSWTSPSASAEARQFCRAYSGCERDLVWCEIPDLAHSKWSGAEATMWAFFQHLL